MAYILAYDFGTGGIKASLYNEDGQSLADGFKSYKTFYPAAEMHEQRPQEWWEAIVQSTREVLALAPNNSASQVAAIGISGHSLGVVPVDKNGVLLRDSVPIWSDSRPDRQLEQFFAQVPEPQWYSMTGNGFPPSLYSVFKLMWFRDNEPEMFRKIYKVLGTKDYINYRLCGVMATDHSYASGSGVYNLHSRYYDNELVAASGLLSSILPEIVPSAHVLGRLTHQSAAELGLTTGVKVVAGGVDNSCMSLGAGAFKEGRAYNSLGSSSWIAVSSAKPLLDKAKRPYVFDHVVPGQYVSALAIFSAGSALSWAASQLCGDLKRCADEKGSSVYQLIDREAETSPVGARGVLFNPTLAGGSSLDITAAVHGAFMNLELRHNRADLLRAVLEGVALGLRCVLDELRTLTDVRAPLTLVGGGSNSSFWRQIYADVYNISVVRTVAGQQAAALGAATIAGVGAGIWNDFSIIDDLSAITDREKPDEDAAQQYEQIYMKYKQAAKLLGEWAL